MGYYFTSESVSEGHPDKVADQISDAVLDEILRYDPTSKVACETLVTTGLVVVAGEIRTNAYVEIQDVARRVIEKIGYNKSEYQFDAQSCGVLSALHGQSNDIFQGVKRDADENQGAGDQGMMFGFACKETENYMPLTIDLSHMLLQELAAIRHEGRHMKYLRPDAKSQVTVEYGEGWKPLRIDTIVISTQHDEFLPNDKLMQKKIEADVRHILIPRVKRQLPTRLKKLFDDDMKLYVNPTGKFVIGGPHGDTGLTGRKIIVDTYGGRGAHGGGAFSGKDSSKVDRSAACQHRRHLTCEDERRRHRPQGEGAGRLETLLHREALRPHQPHLRGNGFLRPLRPPARDPQGGSVLRRQRHLPRRRPHLQERGVLRLGKARLGGQTKRSAYITITSL